MISRRAEWALARLAATLSGSGCPRPIPERGVRCTVASIVAAAVGVGGAVVRGQANAWESAEC
jgi:hypothetical protein